MTVEELAALLRVNRKSVYERDRAWESGVRRIAVPSALRASRVSLARESRLALAEEVMSVRRRMWRDPARVRSKKRG